MRQPAVSTYRMLSFAAAAATALLVACAPEGELLESVSALSEPPQLIWSTPAGGATANAPAPTT